MRSRRRSAAAVRITQELMLVPMVMAMRMPIMAAEVTSSVAGKSESAVAVAEKWQALADGMVAAQFAWIRGVLLFPLSMAKATSAARPLIEMASDVAVAALTPAAKQVRLNHRRLSKRGRR